MERLSFPGLSLRIEVIIKSLNKAGQTEIRNKINIRRGLTLRARVEWEDGEIFIPRSALRDWEAIRQNLDRVDKLVTYYEVREATTLFELALWKANIDREEGGTINRDAYRIEVPGPVKDTILQYLMIPYL